MAFLFVLFLLCAFSAEANKFHSLRKISSFTGTRDSPLVISSLFFLAVVIVSREIRFRASSYDFLLLYPRFPSQTNIVRLFFCFRFLQVEKSGSLNLHRTPDPSTFPAPPGTPRVVNVTESSVTITWAKSQDRPGASPLIG